MRNHYLITLFLAIFIRISDNSPVPDGDFTLRIIHTNDMHARFEQTSKLYGKCSKAEAEENKCYGGYGRVSTAVKQQRSKAEKDNVPLLFLNAGDTYQGSVWYTILKSAVAVSFTNLLNIDAMSLGNHEFDDSIDGILPFLNNVTSPILACNLGLENEPRLAATPLKNSTIIERNGIKFGIIGYLTPETKTLSKSGKVVFYDEIPKITEEARKMKENGVEVIIALGHSGFEQDQIIAKEVPHLDIVVGGHSHTFLYTGDIPDAEIPASLYPTMIEQDDGRKVAVVQAFAYTKYLGILNVKFNADFEVVEASGDPILLDKSVEQDPVILEELERWRPAIDNLTKEEIGKTKVLLDGNSCRFFECNMGNLVADSYRDFATRNYISQGWSLAPIAIAGGGSIRASIDASINNGILTREDLMTVMPFYNSVDIVSLAGKYLLEALEWSVRRYDPDHNNGRGEFLQVSGIRVEYDLEREPGSRVLSADVLCGNCNIPVYEPIDPDAIYNITMVSFLSQGGDSYTMFVEHGTIIGTADLQDTDIVIEYVKTRHVIYPGIEGRIIFHGKNLKGSAVSKVPFINQFLMILMCFIPFRYCNIN